MPRFSLRELMFATALISLGMGAFYMLNFEPPIGNPFHLTWVKAVSPVLFFGGSAFIGAGIFAPFKKTLLGALIGILISAILFAIILVIDPLK